MSIWEFLRNRLRVGRAMELLAIIERITQGVVTRAELAERLAEGAHKGDLDDVLSWAQRHDERVRNFRKG